MKSSQLLTALGFLGILVLLLGGVWLYLLFPAGTGTSQDTADRGVFSTLFPFGRSDNAELGTSGEIVDDPSLPLPRLRQVSDAPVAGAIFVTGRDGEEALRYVERETGHIYEVPLTSRTAVRLTNTTITGVYTAHWYNASTTVLALTSGDTKESFIGSITSTSTDAPLSGAFLEPYARLAVGDGTIVGVREGTGATVERVTVDGARTVVYQSPLTSWVPHTSGGAVYLASAPSGRSLGAVYEVQNGALRKIVGNLLGLQALFGPEEVLVSTGGVNAYELYVVRDETLTPLPRATLADKCGWVDTRVICGIPTTVQGGLYPDDWLLGRVQTSDTLWFIDTVSGVATQIVNPADENAPEMDIIKVAVSPNKDTAAFINKRDQTLWMIDLRAQ